MGAFAEFETAIQRVRKLEGIAKGKANGVYKGPKPSVPVAERQRLNAEGLGASEIAKQLEIARSSVYEALKGE
jgi:DNA invertase Pin-like site-specific DNA recombinase